MIKKRLIPFSWLPAAWGLAGPQREEAEAYYTLDGHDLAERLAEITLSGEMLKRRKIELRRDWGIIDGETFDAEMAEMIADDVEREVARIDADVRHGKMDPFAGDKAIATLRGMPWIRVIDDGLDVTKGVNGYYFEFDWNDVWIEALREGGYTGRDEEAIVEAWFQDVCRSEASATLHGNPRIVS
jgi:hypothetical protein